MTKLFLLLALFCLPANAQQLNSSTSTGNVTMNFGTPATVSIYDVAGNVITIQVTPDKNALAKVEALQKCSDAVTEINVPIANLMARPPATGQEVWKVPMTAAIPHLNACKAGADAIIAQPPQPPSPLP